MSQVRSNFLKLIVGNIGIQLIAFAFYPILTRLYLPDEFGRFGVLISLTQIISIYSWGQLHMALPSVLDKQKQNDLFSLCLILHFISSVFVLFILFLYDFFYDLELIYYCVPFSLLFFGWMEIHKMWAVTNERIGTKTIILNINRLLSNALKLFGYSVWGLILSEIAANIFGVISFFRFSKRSFNWSLNFSKAFSFFVQFRDYWLYFSFYVLAQILTSEALILYLKNSLDEKSLGFFFLGNKLFIQTALIFSATLSLSYTQALSNFHSSRTAIYKKYSMLFGVGMILATIASVPDYQRLVELIFGSEWQEFAVVINFFIFLVPVKMFVGFFAYVLLRADRLKFISVFKASQFVALLMIMQKGFSGLDEFLWIYVPVEVIGDIVFILWGYKIIKNIELLNK